MMARPMYLDLLSTCPFLVYRVSFYKAFKTAAPARASRAAPSTPNFAAAPVLCGGELVAVAVDAEPEAWLPVAAVPEARLSAAAVLEAEAMLVWSLELAAADELLETAEEPVLAVASTVALPALNISSPSTTVAVTKATSVPDSTAVCGSSPVISAVQVTLVATEL